MNTTYKKILTLLLFLSISIYGIAQGTVTITDSELRAERDITIIGKVVNYITHNNFSAAVELLTAHMDSLSNADRAFFVDTFVAHTAYMDSVRSAERAEDRTLLMQNIYTALNNANQKAIQANQTNINIALAPILRKVEQWLNYQMRIEPLAMCFLPFGIHQFTNNRIGKGILFAGTQVALAGGIALTENLRADNASRINTTQDSNRRQHYIDTANRLQTTRNVLIVCVAAAYLWNVLDGIADRSRRQARILNITPHVAPDASGVALTFNF